MCLKVNLPDYVFAVTLILFWTNVSDKSNFFIVIEKMQNMTYLQQYEWCIVLIIKYIQGCENSVSFNITWS